MNSVRLFVYCYFHFKKFSLIFNPHMNGSNECPINEAENVP